MFVEVLLLSDISLSVFFLSQQKESTQTVHLMKRKNTQIQV